MACYTKQLTCTVVALLLTLGMARQADAIPIPGLFSTGVDNFAAVLPGGTPDAHYTVAGGTLGSSTFVVVNPVGLGWLANTATSAWISPDPGGFASPDTYTYTITFNLAGLDASSAVITGQWSAADEGTMFLNGNEVSSSPSSGSGAFTGFSINSGFAPGVNALTFAVPNTTGFSGLHVQIISSNVEQVSAAPEPASVVLLGLGMLLATTHRRRKVGIA